MDKVWKHIRIINGEMGDIQSDVAVLKNDVKWIKWFVGVNLMTWLGLIVKLLIG